MARTDEVGFAPRPVVVVEDRYQHLIKLAEALQTHAPRVRGRVTYVCLQDGPDTAAEVERWLTQRDLDLQVAVLEDSLAAGLFNKHPKQLRLLPPQVCLSPDWDSYSSSLEQLVRPGGVVLQDVELSPLEFARGRPWLSVRAAGTVQATFKARKKDPPILWFMSNKSIHFASLKDALLSVGCDLSRQFFDKKKETWSLIAAAIASHCDRFPLLWLETSRGEQRVIGVDERQDVCSELDIVVWLGGFGKCIVEGRLFDKSIELERGTSNQLAAWVHLVRARIEGRDGVPTIVFGSLRGLEDAPWRGVNQLAIDLSREGQSKSKDYNPSSRLAYKMKEALRDKNALDGGEHLYSLGDAVAVVGIVRRS